MQRFLRTDFLSGAFLLSIACFFLVFGSGYDVGTVAEMGPGFVPRLLAYVLAGIGLFLALKGLAAKGDVPAVTDQPWGIRPMLVVFAGIVLFAATVSRTGYVISSALMLVVVGLASDESRLREVIIGATVLSVATAVVFVILLGIPLPLFPRS